MIFNQGNNDDDDKVTKVEVYLVMDDEDDADDGDDKRTKVAVYLATVGGLLQLGVKSLPHNWTA